MKTTRLLAAIATGLLVVGCITEGDVISTEIDSDEAAQVNLSLGIAYIRQGKLDLAREKLEKSLSHDPELAPAYSALAVVYDTLGEPASAEINYRHAVRLAPSSPAILNTYGVFLCRHGRADEAEEHFIKAARNPRYTTPEVALTNAGVCLRQMEELVRAEIRFREALAKNARFGDALLQMTDIAYQRDNLLQARAFLQRFLAAAPTPNPQILWLGVRIERGLGNRSAADGYAEELKSKFPESNEMTQLIELERRVGAN